MAWGKSNMWLLNYSLNFKIYYFCSPVLVTYYFVTTTSHYFLWLCSWQDLVGNFSASSARAEVTREAVFTWELGLEHPGWSHSLKSFFMRLLTSQWFSPSFFTAWQMDSKRTSPNVQVLSNPLFHHICCCSIGQSKSYVQVQSQCGRDHTRAYNSLLHLLSFIKFPCLMIW